MQTWNEIEVEEVCEEGGDDVEETNSGWPRAMPYVVDGERRSTVDRSEPLENFRNFQYTSVWRTKVVENRRQTNLPKIL